MNRTYQEFERWLKEPSILATSLRKIETLTGIPRTIFALVCSIMIVLYLISGYTAELLTNFITIIYPAFCTIYSIENGKFYDQTRLLKYWLLLGIVTLFEHWKQGLLEYVTYFWLLKTIFFVWSFTESPFVGSHLFYILIIHPVYAMIFGAASLSRRSSGVDTVDYFESFDVTPDTSERFLSVTEIEEIYTEPPKTDFCSYKSSAAVDAVPERVQPEVTPETGDATSIELELDFTVPSREITLAESEDYAVSSGEMTPTEPKSINGSSGAVTSTETEKPTIISRTSRDIHTSEGATTRSSLEELASTGSRMIRLSDEVASTDLQSEATRLSGENMFTDSQARITLLSGERTSLKSQTHSPRLSEVISERSQQRVGLLSDEISIVNSQSQTGLQSEILTRKLGGRSSVNSQTQFKRFSGEIVPGSTESRPSGEISETVTFETPSPTKPEKASETREISEGNSDVQRDALEFEVTPTYATPPGTEATFETPSPSNQAEEEALSETRGISEGNSDIQGDSLELEEEAFLEEEVIEEEFPENLSNWQPIQEPVSGEVMEEINLMRIVQSDDTDFSEQKYGETEYEPDIGQDIQYNKEGDNQQNVEVIFKNSRLGT
ncbi:mucin-21-like [Centruroides vittatus]|uniref:mucin-21-like n=1 Tax=Centruroides vittatus TaxID=120091 RepID=UPI00350F72B5